MDINDYLTNLFVSEDFCNSVFHKNLSKEDWQAIYYGIKSEKGIDYFKNNGILFEHFSNKILSEHFSLQNLINFGNIDFEDPDKGSDIIFFDQDFKLQFYEVKSKCTANQKGNQKDFAELVKNAIISIFCSRLKNVAKLMGAKTAIKGKDELFGSYKLLCDMLNNSSNMINYVDNGDIDFNICIIGEKIDIDDDLLKQEIIEVFNTNKYCPGNCKYNNEVCIKGILDKIIILNIVNIQFLGELSLNVIYEKIIKKIELMGVLDE